MLVGRPAATTGLSPGLTMTISIRLGEMVADSAAPTAMAGYLSVWPGSREIPATTGVSMSGAEKSRRTRRPLLVSPTASFHWTASFIFGLVQDPMQRITKNRGFINRQITATSWTAAEWAFAKEDGVILPSFLQFGKDYRDARDDFVYVYASHYKPGAFSIRDKLRVQRPGEIGLMRIPKAKIMDRTSYEFFRGLDGEQNPQWTKDLRSRRPVFEDPNGVGWNTSVSHNRGLGRYFLITEHTDSATGNIGIFDAPQPWGPWTTVMYASDFGAPTIEPTSFYWNFSNKWSSENGKTFTLVFTGTKSNDSWNTVRGAFSLVNGKGT